MVQLTKVRLILVNLIFILAIIANYVMPFVIFLTFYCISFTWLFIIIILVNSYFRITSFSIFLFLPVISICIIPFFLATFSIHVLSQRHFPSLLHLGYFISPYRSYLYYAFFIEAFYNLSPFIAAFCFCIITKLGMLFLPLISFCIMPFS